MVDQRTAIISSTLTAGLVSASHGATHYLVEGSQSLSTPGVMAAGGVVFAVTWIISYGGMRDLLPF